MSDFRRFSMRRSSAAPVLALMVIAIVLQCAPGGAIAAPDRPKADKAQLAWSPPPLPECTCRAQGKTFQLGAHICLATPDGYRIAECELTQNVTNWRFSSDSCVTSRATPVGNDGRQSSMRLVDACFAGAGRRI